MREQPTQQPPPAQRMRIRYAKRGRLRFTSHRDFSRAFERALVRARVPMAYSSGFNPHPRISYMGAAPTGSASEAEYVEIALAQTCDPEQIAAELDASLPPGLDILEVVIANSGSLADRLQASKWVLSMASHDQAALDRAIGDFLQATSIEVERMSKKGMRTFDVRSAVVELTRDADSGALTMVIEHGTPTVRPGDVLQAIEKVAGTSFTAALHTREWQGRILQGNQLADPFAEDRSAPAQPSQQPS